MENRLNSAFVGAAAIPLDPTTNRFEVGERGFAHYGSM
jgi:hypothetical protein